MREDVLIPAVAAATGTFGRHCMAIQFFCSACGQAIEVDDSAAGVAVTCPYCRKVVVAPAQTDLSKPPVVSGPEPALVDLQPPPRRSVLGWIALACIAISLVCGLYASARIQGLAKDLDLANTPRETQQKMVNERLMENPSLLLLAVGSVCLLPAVGVVCAIIALVIRAKPSWPAITALSLLAGAIILSCAGAILSRGGAAPGG